MAGTSAVVGPSGIKVTVDQKAIDRQLKLLSKYEGRLLHQRAQAAYLAGARLMVQPIRGRITAHGLVKSGNFRRKVSARKPRLRGNEMAASVVGPRSPHRHLLIQGHRIVTPGGRFTGNRTRPHPVVDEAYAQVGERVRSFINEQIVNIGGELRAL